MRVVAPIITIASMAVTTAAGMHIVVALEVIPLDSPTVRATICTTVLQQPIVTEVPPVGVIVSTVVIEVEAHRIVSVPTASLATSSIVLGATSIVVI